MNRLVCERKVNDPVDCLLEVKEQSSRTHGGVRGSPHQSLLVGQSTRLGNRASFHVCLVVDHFGILSNVYIRFA